MIVRGTTSEPAGVAHVAEQRPERRTSSSDGGASGATCDSVESAMPGAGDSGVATAQRERVHSVRRVQLDSASLC